VLILQTSLLDEKHCSSTRLAIAVGDRQSQKRILTRLKPANKVTLHIIYATLLLLGAYPLVFDWQVGKAEGISAATQLLSLCLKSIQKELK